MHNSVFFIISMHCSHLNFKCSISRSLKKNGFCLADNDCRFHKLKQLVVKVIPTILFLCSVTVYVDSVFLHSDIFIVIVIVQGVNGPFYTLTLKS